MKSLLAALFNSGSRLSSIDEMVLACVRDHLEGSIAALWDRQRQAINKVQRLPDGVEVNFYRMKSGRPSFDSSLAFPNTAEELLVAKVLVSFPDLKQELAAKVWCVRGFLFSIEYEGSANYFVEAAGMEPRPKIVLTCELTADLHVVGASKSENL